MICLCSTCDGYYSLLLDTLEVTIYPAFGVLGKERVNSGVKGYEGVLTRWLLTYALGHPFRLCLALSMAALYDLTRFACTALPVDPI